MKLKLWAGMQVIQGYQSSNSLNEYVLPIEKKVQCLKNIFSFPYFFILEVEEKRVINWSYSKKMSRS